jgi:hypothetical protein
MEQAGVKNALSKTVLATDYSTCTLTGLIDSYVRALYRSAVFGFGVCRTDSCVSLHLYLTVYVVFCCVSGNCAAYRDMMLGLCVSTSISRRFKILFWLVLLRALTRKLKLVRFVETSGSWFRSTQAGIPVEIRDQQQYWEFLECRIILTNRMSIMWHYSVRYICACVSDWSSYYYRK